MEELKKFILSYRIPVIFILLAVCLYCFLYTIGIVNNIPDSNNLLQWDSGWYKSVSDLGYQFKPDQQSNTAFFPLFPYIWKLTHLGIGKMSLFNYCIYIFSIGLINYYFKLSKQAVVFCMTLPSLFFMITPYTEALFFLFGVLISIGYFRQKYWLLFLGIFLSCLTRSASNLFLPALIFAELVTGIYRKSAREIMINIIKVILPVILAIAIVNIIQHYQTGVWFAYSKTLKYWNIVFGMPNYPFKTWGGYKLLWLDAPAFFISVMAAVLVFMMAYKVIVKHRPVTYNPLTVFVFSTLALYVPWVLFYKYGDCFSINRYIYCSPFLVIIAGLYFRMGKATIFFRNFSIIAVIAFSALFITRFGDYGYYSTFPYLVALALYLYLTLKMREKQIRTSYFWAYACLNLVIQLYMFNAFMHSVWVG